MNWRPDDWENPCGGMFNQVKESYPNGIPRGYHILQKVGFEEGYEAGADAMLEALKANGVHGQEDDILTDDQSFLIAYDESPVFAKNGWLVFIPEEGK